MLRSCRPAWASPLALVRKSKALDRIRAATPAKPLANGLRRADLLTAAIAPQQRPRLVSSFDATASREPAWDTAREVTDALFTALPGQLDVALAVHGGGRVHTITGFSSDARLFRDQAVAVHCQAGGTALVNLMEQVRTHAGVKVLLYIGDCFEEAPAAAFEQADALRLRGVRAILFTMPRQATRKPGTSLKRSPGALAAHALISTAPNPPTCATLWKPWRFSPTVA